MIPLIIWCLWCDFKNKRGCPISDQLQYFKDRIIFQHPLWNVNIITEWSTLMDLIQDDNTLIRLLDNPIIGPQHKSDAIRFFLLNKFGGFWVDLSTFLLTSLDVYLDTHPNSTFITYYTPPFMVEEILFSSLNPMFDRVDFDEIVKKVKPVQGKYIKLNEKYKKYPFIPENFFIACIPGHPIIQDIYHQIITFWRDSIPRIVDASTLCYELNKLMNNLAGEVFEINDLNYELLQLFDNDTTADKNFLMDIFDKVWNCGYIFNYLQMYISIIGYIKSNHLLITQEPSANRLEEHSENLCSEENENINSCQNIVCIDRNTKEEIYLLSLSTSRLIKWGNTMSSRISMEDTYLSKKIAMIENGTLEPEMLIRDILSMGIYQIKFSSWTRDSAIIPKIMEIYPTPFENGKGRRKRKRKSKRKSKRKGKGKSKKNILDKIFPGLM